MRALTASLLTLGIAAAAGVSTTAVLGEHGQPEAAVTRPEPLAVETPPLAETPRISPGIRCGTAAPACRGPVCTPPLQRTCQASPTQLAADLHLAAATLADDIDFDLYGTCDFAHLMRDAEIVVRDAVQIRRALARQTPIEPLMADIRNAGTSLRHLKRSIGRRYRTRAIHFALLDTEAALDDLTVSLGDGGASETAPLESPRSNTRPEGTDSQLDAPRRPLAVPDGARPPVPPALRSQPKRGRADEGPLVLPAPGDVPVIPESMKGVRQLSPSDQRLAMQQRTCPVTGDLLGSMGKPIKVNVNGRSVFVCCQGCVDEVRNGG